ncbi:MAG: hypothetical protein QXK32_04700 [Candidatus Jordarchaeales archaeon]
MMLLASPVLASSTSLTVRPPSPRGFKVVAVIVAHHERGQPLPHPSNPSAKKKYGAASSGAPPKMMAPRDPDLCGSKLVEDEKGRVEVKYYSVPP